MEIKHDQIVEPQRRDIFIDTSDNVEKQQRRGEKNNSRRIEGRQRRMSINERIGQLNKLVPRHRQNGFTKLNTLESSVNWTRDLMWAHNLKLQREQKVKDMIAQMGHPSSLDLPPRMPEELAIDEQVRVGLESNYITSFSSPDHVSYHARRASEPIQKHSVNDVTQEEYQPQHQLRKATSRGSVISCVASVHSVTSLTYRSPTGDIGTETYGHSSTVSYFEDALKRTLSAVEGTARETSPDRSDTSDLTSSITDGSSEILGLNKAGEGIEPENAHSINDAGYTVIYLENGLVRLRWKCVSARASDYSLKHHVNG